MDEKELKETLKKLGITDIDGHIGIDPKTGKVQKEKWGGLYREDTGHRIDPETARVQKEKWGGLYREDTGHRIDPETGKVQRERWGGLYREDTGHRIDPETGKVQREKWGGLYREDTEYRIDPKSGNLQEKRWGGLFWEDTGVPADKVVSSTTSESPQANKYGSSVEYSRASGYSVAREYAYGRERLIPVSPMRNVVRITEVALLFGGLLLIEFLYTEPTPSPESWRALAIYLAMILFVAFVEHDKSWGATLGSICGGVAVIISTIQLIGSRDYVTLVCFPVWASIFVIVPSAIGFVGGFLGSGARRSTTATIVTTVLLLVVCGAIAASQQSINALNTILNEGFQRREIVSPDSPDGVFRGAVRWTENNLPGERHLPIPMALVEQEVGHPLPPNTIQPIALLKPEVVYSMVVGEHAWAVAYYGCDRQHYSVGDACRQAFPGTGYIIHSSNGGKWEIQEQIPNWTPIGYLGLKFITNEEGYAIGDTGIFYTNNGGKHWNRLSLPSEIQEIRGVESIEGSHLAIACNDSWTNYESFDKGKTWQRKRR